NTEGAGTTRRVTSVTLPNGQPLLRDRKYRVALNTFDSRSAGHRFMRLRAILERDDANCRLHDIQTRDALIEYFHRHQVVSKMPPSCLPVRLKGTGTSRGAAPIAGPPVQSCWSRRCRKESPRLPKRNLFPASTTA